MDRPTDAEAPTWAAPFVHYQCPCWRSGASGDGRTEEGAAGRGAARGEDAAHSLHATGAPADPADADASGSVRPLRPSPDPLSSLAEFAYLPLSRLYFCEECNELRCPRCVQEEIVCYYCPNCLFEVPSAAVRAERNRCTRNCFECPVCCSSMQVVSNELPTGAQPALITVTQGPYYLACPCCRWHSKEIGLEFEKPNWLSSVIQNLEESKPDFVEFEKLSQHYSAHLKSLAPLTKAPAHYPPSLAGSPSSRRGSPYLQQYYQRTALGKQQPDPPCYEPVTTARTEDVDEELLSEMMSEIDVSKVSTLAQRMRQFDDQHHRVSNIRPRRIHLRKKTSKRCRSCRHLIVKPEAKGQSTRFRIKMVALDYVPTLTLSGFPETISPGKPFTVVLTFTNPLYQSINVRLSLPSVASPGAVSEGKDEVVLVAPEFSVAPYSDVWVYEQFRDVGTSSLGDVEEETALRQRASKRAAEGIVARKGNATSVLVEVIPRRKFSARGVVFPLLVSYTYDPDEKSGSPTYKKDGTADGVDGVPAATTERKLLRRSRSHAFWVSIGIGHKIED